MCQQFPKGLVIFLATPLHRLYTLQHREQSDQIWMCNSRGHCMPRGALIFMYVPLVQLTLLFAKFLWLPVSELVETRAGLFSALTAVFCTTQRMWLGCTESCERLLFYPGVM